MATMALAKRSASQEEVAPLSPCANPRTMTSRLSSTLTVSVPSPGVSTPGGYDEPTEINEMSAGNQLRIGCRVLVQRAISTVYMPFPDRAQEEEYRWLALSSHRYYLFLAFLLYGVGMVILTIVEGAGGINTDKEKTGVTYTLVRPLASSPDPTSAAASCPHTHLAASDPSSAASARRHDRHPRGLRHAPRDPAAA